MITINYIDEMITCQKSSKQEQIREVRLDRVLEMQRKIRSGQYNPAQYMDIVVDRLLEEILEQNPENQIDLTGTKNNL